MSFMYKPRASTHEERVAQRARMRCTVTPCVLLTGLDWPDWPGSISRLGTWVKNSRGWVVPSSKRHQVDEALAYYRDAGRLVDRDWSGHDYENILGPTPRRQPIRVSLQATLDRIGCLSHPTFFPCAQIPTSLRWMNFFLIGTTLHRS